MNPLKTIIKIQSTTGEEVSVACTYVTIDPEAGDLFELFTTTYSCSSGMYVPDAAINSVSQRMTCRVRNEDSYKISHIVACTFMNSKFPTFPDIDRACIHVNFAAFLRNIEMENRVNSAMGKRLDEFKYHCNQFNWRKSDNSCLGAFVVAVLGYCASRNIRFNGKHLDRFARFVLRNACERPLDTLCTTAAASVCVVMGYKRRNAFGGLCLLGLDYVGSTMWKGMCILFAGACKGARMVGGGILRAIKSGCAGLLTGYRKVDVLELSGCDPQAVSVSSIVAPTIAPETRPILYEAVSPVVAAHNATFGEVSMHESPAKGETIKQGPEPRAVQNDHVLANTSTNDLHADESATVVVGATVDVPLVINPVPDSPFLGDTPLLIHTPFFPDHCAALADDYDMFADYVSKRANNEYVATPPQPDFGDWSIQSLPPVLVDDVSDNVSELSEAVSFAPTESTLGLSVDSKKSASSKRKYTPSVEVTYNMPTTKQLNEGVTVCGVVKRPAVEHTRVIQRAILSFQIVACGQVKYTEGVRDLIKQNLGTCNLLGVGMLSTTAAHPAHLKRKKFLLVTYPKLDSDCPLKPASTQRGVIVKAYTEKVPKKLDFYFVPDSHEQIKSMEVFHLGPAYVGMLPGTFAPTIANELLSLRSRHIVGVPDSRDNRDLWREAFDRVNPYIFSIISPYYEVTTTEAWINGQPPFKRTLYQKYIDELGDLDFADEKTHARSFFIKAEVQLPSVSEALTCKAPRGIQGMMKPSTNLALGPFITSVSKAYSAPFMEVDIDAPTREWPMYGYTSGSTNTRIGQWYFDHIQAGYDIAEDDFSSYDSTQGIGAHCCEVDMFQRFNPPDSALEALKQQSFTKGYGLGHYYQTPYTRKSGDQNTGVGNTHVQFVAHTEAVSYAMSQTGLSAETIDVKMIGLGDDNLLAVKFLVKTTKDEKIVFFWHVEAHLKELGLKPKLSLPDVHTYCSGYFMPITRNGKDTMVLVPSPIRKIAKMGWCCDASVVFDPLMRMKGNELGGPINAYVPVSRVFYDFYTKMGGNANVEARKWYTYISSDDDFVVDGRQKQWFCETFGVTVHEIEDLENYIHTHLKLTGGLASFWSHPVMDKIIKRE